MDTPKHDLELSPDTKLQAARDYLIACRDFAFSKGISSEELLEGIDADIKILAVPPERVDLSLIGGVVLNLTTRLEKPLLEAIEFGSMMTASTHGSLSLAIRSSENLQKAGLILQQYLETRSNILTVNIFERQNDVVIQILPSDKIELSEYDERVTMTRGFYAFSLLIHFFKMIPDLLHGHYLSGQARINLDCPAPSYASEIPPIENLSISFDQAFKEMSIPSYWTLLPFSSSDSQINPIALAECKNELKKVSPNNIVEIIKGHLATTAGPLPNLETMSSRLNMSASTLQRRLAKERTTYSDLRNNFKIERAKQLLEKPEFTIEQIASQMGFGDNSNFSKFIRKNLGMTAKQYRASHQ